MTVLTRSELLQILNVTDALSIIVRGHQAVERALNAAVSEALPDPHALEIQKLTFSLKVDLAVALGAINTESRGALQALNKVRNRFAHNLDAEFKKSDARDLANSLSVRQRGILGNEPSSFEDSLELLRHIIAILFFECLTARDRLKEAKLADEVLHELVEETLANAPTRKSDALELEEIKREIQTRVEVKKHERGLHSK